MTYLTYIPTQTHAEREQRFFSERAQARESYARLRSTEEMLLQGGVHHLSRNYVDMAGLKTLGEQIVGISREIRKVYKLALRPDPPRYVPVSEGPVETEARIYGGVKASRLVRVLAYLQRLRATHGKSVAALRLARVSDKMIYGLDVYQRVKALVAKLRDAVDAPETVIVPKVKRISSVSGRPDRPRFQWEVSPQEMYGWDSALTVKGYDPRQTSVYWLERQATALKGALYRDYHGREVSGSQAISVSRPQAEYEDIDIRVYTPPEGATLTHEVWPPIDLVRFVEEMRDHVTPPPSLPPPSGEGRGEGRAVSSAQKKTQAHFTSCVADATLSPTRSNLSHPPDRRRGFHPSPQGGGTVSSAVGPVLDPLKSELPPSEVRTDALNPEFPRPED